MWIFRAILILLAGLLLGVLTVGVVAALPYPFSLFPLLPVCVALALVLRLPLSTFWIFLVAVGITDVYRGAGFGVGILAYVCVVYIMSRVATEVVTHRSYTGCAVIAAGVGLLWAALHVLFSGFGNIEWAELPRILLIQGLGTALVTTTLYILIPRWWTSRSPSRVGHIL